MYQTTQKPQILYNCGHFSQTFNYGICIGKLPRRFVPRINNFKFFLCLLREQHVLFYFLRLFLFCIIGKNNQSFRARGLHSEEIALKLVSYWWTLSIIRGALLFCLGSTHHYMKFRIWTWLPAWTIRNQNLLCVVLINTKPPPNTSLKQMKSIELPVLQPTSK